MIGHAPKPVFTRHGSGPLPIAFTAPVAGDSKHGETIEIVIAPPPSEPGSHRRNVGIEIDETLVCKILRERYENVVITQIETREQLEQLAVRAPDLVFSGVKFFTFDGEDLWLNDFLDRHAIAYIASGRYALDNEHDKARAKHIVGQANVATAGFFLTAPGEHPTAVSLPLSFPLFIKPVTGGDSRGVDAMSVVHDFAAFQRKVFDIHENQKSRAMVETYLSGREYSVGILEDPATGKLRAMPIEIASQPNANGDRILDYDVKRQDAETVSAVTDAAVHLKLCTLAKAAFRALGGKSIGRIDVKMNGRNVPHFIEANLMPGLRKGYFYRSCMLNLGMDYEAMILTIARNGLASKTKAGERSARNLGGAHSVSTLPRRNIANAQTTKTPQAAQAHQGALTIQGALGAQSLAGGVAQAPCPITVTSGG
ncbi:MAG: D-alanine--D-alanine ligase [Rhodobacteraceae bacterium]|nr:D-alanine--D-alanine ligase [Paracoccaceae bacterium]